MNLFFFMCSLLIITNLQRPMILNTIVHQHLTVLALQLVEPWAHELICLCVHRMGRILHAVAGLSGTRTASELARPAVEGHSFEIALRGVVIIPFVQNEPHDIQMLYKPLQSVASIMGPGSEGCVRDGEGIH